MLEDRQCFKMCLLFMFTDLRQLPDSTYPLQRISEAGSGGGLFPKPFNVALKAKITANATCGDDIEEYCRMADIYSPRYETLNGFSL